MKRKRGMNPAEAAFERCYLRDEDPYLTDRKIRNLKIQAERGEVASSLLREHWVMVARHDAFINGWAAAMMEVTGDKP